MTSTRESFSQRINIGDVLAEQYYSAMRYDPLSSLNAATYGFIHVTLSIIVNDDISEALHT